MVDTAEKVSAVSQGVTTTPLAPASASPADPDASLPSSGNKFSVAANNAHRSSTMTPIDSDEDAAASSNPKGNDTANMASGEPDESNAVSDAVNIRLPEELWLKVIAHLGPKDLKNVRLVKTSFKDFATPSLFRTVVFSPEPANIRHLKLLAKTQHVAKHVECLYLDLTTYASNVTSPEQYAKLASEYFSKVFGMGPQDKGPLSQSSLYALLLTDPFKSVGHNFLSGKPRGAFTAGFTLYSARSHYLMELFGKDKLFHILQQLVSGFRKLKEVATIPYWTASNDPYQEDFQLYLRHNLPQKTLDLIPRMKSTKKDTTKPFKIPTGAFAAPGVAARDLHVMMLPPNYGICYHDMQVHEITHATLRALRENKVRLKYLALPGSDYIGQELDAKERRGIVPLTTLLSSATSPDATKPTSLLLPVLRRLKVLELNIDFKHPGGPDSMREPLTKSRLRTALQRMDQLESLSLGAPAYLVGDSGVWNLTDLLLWKKDDYPEQSSPDPGPGPGPGGLGAAQGLNGLMNMLMSIPGFGNALNGANLPPPNPNTANVANSAQQTTSTSSNVAGGSNSAGNAPAGPPGNDFAQLVGGGIASIDAHGNVASAPFSLFDPNDAANGEVSEGDDSAEKTKLPDDALTPNPWPKLRYLSLWNLPSSPEEVSRLVKTVKDSLRTLKLSNVHFARPDTIIDDGFGMYLDVGFDGPPPPVGNAPPGQAGEQTLNDAQDDSDDQDLPDLVDLVDQPASPDQSATPDVAAPASTPAAPVAPVAPPAAATASNMLHVPAHLFGQVTMQPNAMQPPSTNTGASDQATLPKDTSDTWLSTIEMLAEQLRLTSCDITIEQHDEDYLWHKLSKEIVDMPSSSLGQMVGRYLMEGEGMGFTLFLANKLRELREPSVFVRPNLSDNWDEDEESENGSENERRELMKQPPKLHNVHICSNWQACPGKDYLKF